MQTKLMLGVAALAILAACDESEYDLVNLVPEQYHTILYLNNSGTNDLTLYNTGENNILKLSVFKGGSESKKTASAKIGVLSQELVDGEYGASDGVSYKIIGTECYSIDETKLDFSSEEMFKEVIVSINVPNVEKAIADNPGATCVLPLYLYSEADSVNANKDRAFIKIAQVLTPTLGFISTDIAYRSYTVGFESETAEIDFGLDTDNHWNIDCGFEVDAEYVAAYNAKYGTSFKVLPEGCYSFEKAQALADGVTIGKLAVMLQGNGLQPIDYMLPIRIAETSMFGVSENALYPLIIRVVGSEFDRSGWSITANTEEKTGEGAGNGVAKCVLDGNINSFWHSQWQGGSLNLPHELVVDVKEEVTFSHFGLMERQHASYKDVKAGEFYVSLDNKTWTLVGTFEAQQVYENQIFPVTPTEGRYFKIRITASNRAQNSSLAEIYAYGMK